MFTIDKLFSDNAILQRDEQVNIFGTGENGQEIQVEIAGQTNKTTVENNHWLVSFDGFSANTKTSISVKNENEEIIINDVIFGDIWLLGGQSNMQLWMGRVKARYPDEIPAANNTNIRYFQVPAEYNFASPQDSLTDGNWQVANPDNVVMWSAIGYFFAKELNADLDVPIGLIGTAQGGTPVEAWMSKDLLSNIGYLPDDFDLLNKSGYVENIQKTQSENEQKYLDDLDKNDFGLIGKWFATDLDDSQWDTFPKLDENILVPTGSTWFRKTINVPKKYVGKAAQLRFGTVTDADEFYVNGEKIGETGYMYPPRNYDINKLPEQLTLVIRLKVFGELGGFTENKQHLIFVDEKPVIDFDELGEWKYKQAASVGIKPGTRFFQYEPTGLFNGMLYPLRKLALKGVLWYQAESNDGEPFNYSTKFSALIQEWRNVFNQPNLPFLYVQLPNFTIDGADWSYIREEQRKILSLLNTGMITTIDVGEDNDLHPTDKKTVAHRLALAAKQIAYKEINNGIGPNIQNVRRVDDYIEITFSNISSIKTAPILHAGSTIYSRIISNFKVNGNKILIKNDDLGDADEISYNPENIDEVIYNESNLPLTPFIIQIPSNKISENGINANT